MKRLVAVLFLFALLAEPAASATRRSARSQITVYAASSLTNVFPAIDESEKYSFGGSNTLAAQITQGAPADVFASANMTLPRQLFQEGLCSKPVVFTRNTLVIVVPKSNPAGIRNIYDLTRSGIKLDIAAPGVPVGSYTLQVLKNMNLSSAVLKNVVSQETDVKGVLGKVVLGEADAGFVYATDVKPVLGKVGVIRLRESAQPHVVYEVAVVKNSTHLPAAYAFVTRLIRPAGQLQLIKYGFGPRPKPVR